MEIEKIYPLSPMQEEMFFHWLSNSQSLTYFDQNTFTLNSEVDISILEKSLNLLIERYDILRTIFRSEKVREPIQIVLKERKLNVQFEDISHLSEKEKEKRIKDFLQKDQERGLDLTRDLLMRISLFKTGEKQYKLIWTQHHILMDGWCMNILFRDFIKIYYSLINEKGLILPPVIPYRNYIKWLKKQDREKGLYFWKEYLKGYEKPVGLIKFGKERGTADNENYRKAQYDHIINRQLTLSLHKIAREIRVTDNAVFQTIWGTLLQLYNNAKDILYGIVVSGRPPEVEGIENMVGLFINTVPIRITINPAALFSQLAKEVQQEILLSKSYQYISLAEIQANSYLKNRLIDHIVSYENYPPIAAEFKHVPQTGEFRLYDSSIQLNQQSYYHLSVAIVPGEQLLVRFFFNTRVFDQSFIEKIGKHLDEIIQQVAYDPHITLQDIVISDDLTDVKTSIPEKEYINFEF